MRNNSSWLTTVLLLLRLLLFVAQNWPNSRMNEFCLCLNFEELTWVLILFSLFLPLFLYFKYLWYVVYGFVIQFLFRVTIRTAMCGNGMTAMPNGYVNVLLSLLLSFLIFFFFHKRSVPKLTNGLKETWTLKQQIDYLFQAISFNTTNHQYHGWLIGTWNNNK